MLFSFEEINETIKMIEVQNLDVRTITMGISLLDCIDSDAGKACKKIYEKICHRAKDLTRVGEEIELEYGIPIINKRISVTPISIVAAASPLDHYIDYAMTLEKAALETGVNFIGGFSALVHKGYAKGDRVLIYSIPEALCETERVCSSVNIATTKAGINMDAVKEMGVVVKRTATLSKDRDGIGCAKLVVFANTPEDNPFMAGAFHGIGEYECAINVGVSGPGVIKSVLETMKDSSFDEIAVAIKNTAFKITRMGQLVAREASRRLDVPFGIIDLSLAPTPAVGDSVARIIEEMGIESCGAPGSTAALALLNDAVKKGGVMASSHVGGLSGSFIPLSEDSGMVEALERGSLCLEKLEALTSVCSVGLDMIAIPGDVPPETISAIIADEAAIGVMNNKTTAVRLIPVPGKKAGDRVEFGGLLGSTKIMDVSRFSSALFINRGGRIPAPVISLRN
jgi:uncharacterized protein (UPF0210 family)